ncbi:MAG: ATP-dependent DNA ligase [Candidatus Aenigmarchaeota archaeon]|nr:ATP-dependent DNA ligase [Candidatus Aenigmarchaeota archaeon]
MEYKKLAEVYNKLESTTLKLEKTEIISQFLSSVEKDELDMVIFLLTGNVYPGWSSSELGLSSNLMIKAISRAYGVTALEIEEGWKTLGDLGLVAEKYSVQKKQATLFSRILTVRKVFDNLRKIGDMGGMRSQDKKLALVSELLGSVSNPFEARYLARTVIGDLRIGVAEGILRDAIAGAFFTNIYSKETLDQKVNSMTKLGLVAKYASGRTIAVDSKLDAYLLKKHEDVYTELKSSNDVVVRDVGVIGDDGLSKEKSGVDYVFFYDGSIGNEAKSKIISSVEHAYNMTNDFSVVAQVARDEGLSGLHKLHLTANHPIKVMLYQKALTIDDAFDIVGKPAAIEYKYDGFRLQIHKTEEGIHLFTRRLEEVTRQFPDVVSAVSNNVSCGSFILDCEVVGVDKVTGKWLPFQKISRRIRRKYDIDEIVKEIPVTVHFFDAMMIDGKNLIDTPYSERRKLLESVVSCDDNVMVAKHIVTSQVSVAKEFYDESLSRGNEGIMMKNMSAPYKPGSRVGYGIKIKPTMDSLDLVIVGADYGEGKRAGWFSSFNLACYDPDSGEYLTIGKLGTGIKEKSDGGGTSFHELTELLKPHIIEEKGKSVTLKPTVVIEVHFEEIQKSLTYSSGFALRFPRLVRLRDDRMPEDSSNIDEISMVYGGQRGRG